MANAKVVICVDEATGKSIAAALKKPTGGGYKNVDGPFKTDSLLVETFGLGKDMTFEFTDNTDAETWFVVGRP
jgi:hypothetical protein